MVVENNFGAEGGGDVIDETTLDMQGEHFLQTEGLGTELGVVVGPAAGRAFFVFDRAGLDDAGRVGRIAADFDEIGLPGEAEGIGEERQSAKQFPTGTVFVAWGVHVFVGEVAEEGMLVGHKYSLGVNEVSAPSAVDMLIEGAEGYDGGLGIHKSEGRGSVARTPYQQILKPWAT